MIKSQDLGAERRSKSAPIVNGWRAQPDHGTLTGLDANGNWADLFVEHKLVAILSHDSFLKQDKARSDRWMARKFHFLPGREDLYACNATLSVRWDHKRRLGQVQFARDSLHRRSVEASSLGEHRQRIAFQRVG